MKRRRFMSDLEVKMTIKTLASKNVTKRDIARQLGLSEGTVRYHLKRMASSASDGRAKRRVAADFAGAIDQWRGAKTPRENSADLHDWLVAEHDYPASLRSLQRYLAERYPAPKRHSRRRVETPPGVQAQIDWAHHRGVIIDGQLCDLYSFHHVLSYSTMPAVVWSDSMNLSSWLHCYNRAFERIGGIAACLRVDNCKTAVVHGAGSWGTLNEGYRRYAETVRFHIDLCPPREPRAKGKVEREVRAFRQRFDPRVQPWDSLEQLQAHSDAVVLGSARRRICPATGTNVLDAFEAERTFLAPVPSLPEPFDCLARRTVASDCMIAFENRQYSVPFRYVGEQVEVRGTHRRIQILHGNSLVAEHERGTDQRVVTDRRHYEGEASERVIPPPPLGRMGRVLEALGDTAVEERPVDLYAAIAQGLAR